MCRVDAPHAIEPFVRCHAILASDPVVSCAHLGAAYKPQHGDRIAAAWNAKHTAVREKPPFLRLAEVACRRGTVGFNSHTVIGRLQRMGMQRRDIVKAGVSAAAAIRSAGLARPALAQPAATRVLKFIPQSDIAVVDPIVTTAYVTRNHAYVIYDTLYGIDADFRPQPQMAEGHSVEDGGRRV